MILGVDYSPEYWGEAHWKADADLMLEAGISLIRAGRYSWSMIEPRRESYQFDWLDKAVDYFNSRGIKTLLCTPSAVPPVWLVQRHPSMLAKGPDGVKRSLGGVHIACVNNEPYRKYVRRVVQEIALHYRKHPALFGWQVDAELGSHSTGRCYCDDCVQRFRQWLKSRYGSIGRLNQYWAGASAGYLFSDWLQVPVPRATTGLHLPCMHLDFCRFCSDSQLEFVGLQLEILRQVQPKALTLVELSPESRDLDFFQFGQGPDAVAMPAQAMEGRRWRRSGLAMSLARGAGSGRFWSTRLQTGIDWSGRMSETPVPGHVRLWAYQALAHNAEGVILARWRAAPSGPEAGLGGIVSPDGEPGDAYQALKRFAGELQDHDDAWVNLASGRRIALVCSAESQWALEHPSVGDEFDYRRHLVRFYDALRSLGCDVDIVRPGEGLGGYQIAVVPTAVVHRETVFQDVRTFVRTGGRLIVTFMLGSRDTHNGLSEALPAKAFEELTGVSLRRAGPLAPGSSRRIRLAEATRQYECVGWADEMKCLSAHPVAHYTGGALEGEPAVTRNNCGKGVCYYVGVQCEHAFYVDLVGGVLSEMRLPDVRWTGSDLEVICSPGRERAWVFALNHGPAESVVEFSRPYRDMLTGETFPQRAGVAPYGIRFLESIAG